MYRAQQFAPTKDYILKSEESKSDDKDAPSLAKVIVTIPNPRSISNLSLQAQFKDKFLKGAVNGILPELSYEKNDPDKPKITVTFNIGSRFDSEADKLFREVISQLDQLSLRDKDALRSEYERCLVSHNIISEYTKGVGRKGGENNHRGGSMAF